MIRTYSELVKIPTFIERFKYLQLNGLPGKETFGFERYLNQNFYTSYEWKRLRDQIIIRDQGCDLGIEGHEIHNKILIHHMNPIKTEDIVRRSDFLMNPEYLICTTKRTHDAIHFSDESILFVDAPVRSPGDTLLW